MKRKNNILLISIPLGVLLLLYYGYIALDTWIQFQIRTGNGISAANSEWIFSIQIHVSFYTEMVWPGFISRMFVRNSKMAKKERIKKKLQNQQNNC